MKPTLKTKEEHHALLKETIKYYGKDPQAVRGMDEAEDCMYITKDGRMCAVGRCMSYPDGALQHKGLDQFTPDSLDESLKEEYRGYDYEFWDKLQALHDTTPFWEYTGLSLTGENEVAGITRWIDKATGIKSIAQ